LGVEWYQWNAHLLDGTEHCISRLFVGLGKLMKDT
jgi:hypothetical protein